MKKTDLDITGMHCASCATLINRSLSKAEGVSEANVNYAAARARVVFDEKKLTELDLIKLVQSKGYEARVNDGHINAEEREKSQRLEINNIRTSLIFSACFAIPAFILGMVFMPLGINIPYIEFILFVLATRCNSL
jgi:Cu+-exporting ATPase